MDNFEYYEDRQGDWRWRLKAGNGQIVADSGEGYRRREECIAGSRLFQQLGPEAPIRDVDEDGPGEHGPEWEMYTDRAGESRWRFQAKNNRNLADSAEGYASKSNCRRAIETVKEILRKQKGGGGGFTPPKKPSNPGGGRFA